MGRVACRKRKGIYRVFDGRPEGMRPFGKSAYR